MTEQEKFEEGFNAKKLVGLDLISYTFNKQKLAEHFNAKYIPMSSDGKTIIFDSIDWSGCSATKEQIKEYIYKCMNRVEEKNK